MDDLKYKLKQVIQNNVRGIALFVTIYATAKLSN